MVGRWMVLGLGWALFACAGKSTSNEADGDDCVSLCEKGKAERCTGSELLTCEDNCLGEDVRVEATGCRSEYTTTLVCTAELDDICTVVSSCSGEIGALRNCYAEYCADHPNASVCRAPAN